MSRLFLRELLLRVRQVASVSSRFALARTEQMAFHFPRAIENGVTQDELVEMMTHLAFYAGWPAAFAAIGKAKDLFAQQ